MNLFGIALRRPRFNEVTAAGVMAAGLWVAAVGLAHALHLDMDRADAGALLIVIAWGCVSVRLGIRIGTGRRHLVANLAVNAVLLMLYRSAMAFAG
jgi:hypothetical protein